MLLDGTAATREVVAVDDGRAQDLGAVSGAKRFDELQGLHARGEDVVDGRQPERRDVHRVDPRAVLRADARALALLEAQAQHLQPQLVGDDAQDRGPGDPRDVDARVLEDASQDDPTFLDVPGRQQVRGGGPLEAGSLGPGRPLGGLEIGVSRGIAPSRPSEDLGATCPQPSQPTRARG